MWMTVEVRHHPVAARHHLAADFGIAAFGGFEQAARALEQERNAKGETHHREPGTRTARRGGGWRETHEAVAAGERRIR